MVRMVMVWMIVWIIVAKTPMIRVVAHIPIPVVPRVVGVSPHSVVEWRAIYSPSIYPWRRVDTKGNIRSTPRTKHRGHILRLYPDLISRHHNIVKCRVVCRSIAHRLACSEVVVARRQAICWRVEAIETARVCTLVVISHNRGVVLACSCVVVRLGKASLPHSLARLSLSLLRLGTCCKLLGNPYAVVGYI